MDNTEQSPNVLSLCTGYGGIELGLNQALGNVTTLAHVEIEAFAAANLVNKMETGQLVPVPIWTDLKTLNARIFRGRVDLLTGGYPCQPFSAAGKRKGEDDPRHLWPYIGGSLPGRQNIIEQCRPRGVFFENVEGHLSLGVCEVLADLERMGYEVTAGIFSAAEVGAPHQRKRVFILGYSKSDHKRRARESPNGRQKQTQGSGHNVADTDSIDRGSSPERWVNDGKAGRSSEELADTRSKGLEGHTRNEHGTPRQGVGPDRPVTESSISLWPARPGENQYSWEEPRTVANPTNPDRRSREETIEGQEGEWRGAPGEQTRSAQPQLGRTTTRTPSRVDRLRLLGNGVVPQVAEKAFITLHNKLINRR